MNNDISSSFSIKKVFSTRSARLRHLGLPAYSLGEELTNAITHGLGLLLSVAALVILIVVSAPAHNPLQMLCMLIYGVSLVLLYLCSTLYHAMGLNRAKQVFRVFDHCSIFLLIAGTYTPFTLLVVGGTWGLGIFIAVWLCAVLGIVLNAVSIKRFKAFSMASYIGMGWCIVLVFGRLSAALPELCTYLLLLGGLLYTFGAVIFKFGGKVGYMHALWHLFVLGGSIAHFFAIFLFIL